MAPPWPALTAEAPGVPDEHAAGVLVDSGVVGAEPPRYLTEQERAQLDASTAELLAQLDGVRPGSLAAHTLALGDLGLARAAYERGHGGRDDISSAFALHLSRVPPSVRDAICVTPPPAHRPPTRTLTVPADASWRPSVPREDAATRRRLWSLRRALQPLSEPRQRACGFCATSCEGVGVLVNAEGRARWSGLQHCGSVWACPICAAGIKARRAQEISEVAEYHGTERLALMTLTVRHHAAHSLRTLRRGLANAYRGLCRGDPWRRFVARVGLVGMVRAAEVTHGSNGWHPHLHVLAFTDEPLRWSLDEERAAILEADGVPAREAELRSTVFALGTFQPDLRKPPVDAMVWLRERWSTMVERYLGAEYCPDFAHGVDFMTGTKADYISKLGLEVTDASARKRARAGSRTVLQIADDWRQRQDPKDKRLWLEYIRAMKGARQLTWSRGALELKKAAGLRERSDQELAEDEEIGASDDRLVAVVPPPMWSVLRATVYNGRPAAVWALEVLELFGAESFRAALFKVQLQHDNAKRKRQRRRSPP